MWFKLGLGFVAWFLWATICRIACMIWPAVDPLWFWLMIAGCAALVLAFVRMKLNYARTHRH